MQTDVETYENMHDVCLLELQLPQPPRAPHSSPLDTWWAKWLAARATSAIRAIRANRGNTSAGAAAQVGTARCSSSAPGDIAHTQNLVDIGKATALSRSMSFTAHAAEAR